MSNGHQHHHIAEDITQAYKPKAKKRLFLGIILTASMMLIELFGGFVTGSLSLISDAGHMLTHFIALLVALIALIIAGRQATKHYTYGYFRAEILGGLFNAIFVISISLYLFVEAIARLFTPVPIAALEMLIIGLAGLLVNIATALLLHGISHDDLNVKGAFIHVLGDTISSFGVITAAIIITFTGLIIADTIASFIIALLILFWGLGLIRDTTAILLQSTPRHIDIDQLITHLKQHFPQIIDVYDVHIWTLTPRNYYLSAHVQTGKDCKVSETHQLIQDIYQFLDEHFSIHHATVQVECFISPSKDKEETPELSSEQPNGQNRRFEHQH